MTQKRNNIVTRAVHDMFGLNVSLEPNKTTILVLDDDINIHSKLNLSTVSALEDRV